MTKAKASRGKRPRKGSSGLLLRRRETDKEMAARGLKCTCVVEGKVKVHGSHCEMSLNSAHTKLGSKDGQTVDSTDA